VSVGAASCDSQVAIKVCFIVKRNYKRRKFFAGRNLNVNQTGLFWEKLPPRPYISGESTVPGLKSGKLTDFVSWK
jgi:hypothetical protein